jgi:hypothetical protein
MRPSNGPDRRPLAIIVAALVLIAGAAAAQPAADSLRLAVADTMFVTDLELRGIAWISDDTTLTLEVEPDTIPDAPPLSSTLVWTGADGEVLREFDVTGVLTRGLAYDGEWIWGLADPTAEAGALLVQLEPDTLYVEETYELPGHRPSDIAWDGDSLWIVDRDRGRLDRFDLESEDVTRSMTTPGFSPTGVAHDGRFLWVADFATGKLDRLSRGGSVWNGTVAADSYFRRGEVITLHWGRHSLWILEGGRGYLLQLQPEEGDLTESHR